ncbi:MAG TPA: helicase-related protein, partial [Roseiflexaceae bacterium]
FGGVLHGFFYYHYRLNPRLWQRLGLGWDDCDEAVRRYAFQKVVTKEFESAANRGSGQTTVVQTVQAAPGISARLIPYLLSDYVYIGVPDVGANMPPREEIPVVVPMDDLALRARRDAAQAALDEAKAQHIAARERYGAIADDDRSSGDVDQAQSDLQAAGERLEQAQHDLAAAQEWVSGRDLRRAYASAEQRLSELAKQSDAAKLAKDTLLRWWSILPFWDDPRFTVTQTRKGDWGDVEGTAEIYCAPLLASDHRYPLEMQLREIVTREVAEGRPTMIYYEQNDRRSTADRLLHVLADFAPWALSNRVEAEDREAAIQAAVAAGHLVVIVPYRRVLEGLNLQCIKNVVWYELAQNLFMLDQASRRAWRLGQRDLVRIYYLVMEGTASYYKLVRLGQMNGAASLFAGDTVTNPLATFGGANKLALAKLSQRLAERAADDLTAAFQRRNEELAAELQRGTRWIGVTDTLAERIAVRRAALAMQPQLTTAGEPSLSTIDMGDAAPLPLELVEHT